jgi:zinc D-Ala-D-Ala carboxypeptidase
MRLSKNFTLKELTHSNTAVRLGIENNPDKEGIWNLTLLATELLQPIRDCLSAPLRITSGYRSPELNAIFGANRSQHMLCEAVDLQFVKRGKMDNLKIYNALIDLDLDYDQCILEFGYPPPTVDRDTDYPSWIHLSWKISDNRRETLIAYKDENNKTKYRPINNLNSI